MSEGNYYYCCDDVRRPCSQLDYILEQVIDYLQSSPECQHSDFDEVNKWIQNYTPHYSGEHGGHIIIEDTPKRFQKLSFSDFTDFPSRDIYICFTLKTLTQEIRIPLQGKAEDNMVDFYRRFLKPKSRRGEK